MKVRDKLKLRVRQQDFYIKNRSKILKRSNKRYKTHREEIKRKNRDRWFSKNLKDRQLESRRRSVKYLYKLSSKDHEALLKKQNYKCPITGRPLDISSAIDHDHDCCPGIKSCGKCIRGILDKRVNSALGMFSNPRQLLKAHEYLTRPRL
jgi:hypothetical protein